jgi:hypothetical protein
MPANFATPSGPNGESKGVIDLTLALQMGRVFPMVKAGLGYAKECRRVRVDGDHVDVVGQAA